MQEQIKKQVEDSKRGAMYRAGIAIKDLVPSAVQNWNPNTVINITSTANTTAVEEKITSPTSARIAVTSNVETLSPSPKQ